MYTQCPSCHTVFRVLQKQLEIAHGKVRCSHCQSIFNALANLKKQDSEQQEEKTKEVVKEVRPEVSKNKIIHTESHDADRHALLEDILELNDVVGESSAMSFKFGVMDFVWLLGCLILVGIAIGQLGYIKRLELSQQPENRATAILICQIFDCDLPPLRDIRAITINNRDIRQHSDVKNALLMNITIINNARFDQPFPRMMLTITGTTGDLIARRIFKPVEYLREHKSSDDVLKSQSPVHFVLEIDDPGKDATGFEFDFL